MADVITRFKLETTQYDSKLRDAAKGLSNLTHQLSMAGNDFERFAKEHVNAAKSLATVESGATNLKDKLRDLVGAYNEAAKAYNTLSKEQQNGEFGQAMAASLQTLQSRIKEAKSQLYGLTSESGKTGGFFDTLSSKLTLNIDALKLFNAGLQATQTALSVAKDAFFASEQNLDDWNRMVYSSESVYQGFLTALNTGDISGYLNNINTIVKAASDAYNALDRLGTMKTIDTPQLTDKQSEIQRMQTMLRTGRWVDRADGVKSTLGYKTGDVLPKDVLNTIAQQLKSAMSEVAGIMKQEIGAANTAIDALYKQQAAELGMSNEQFRKGTASMAAFEENLQKAQKYLDFEREHTTSVTSTTSAGIAYTTNVRDNVANPFEQYKGWKVFKDDGDLYQRIVQEIRNRGAAESQYYSQVGQAYRGINRVENVKVGGGTGGTKVTKQEQAQKAVEAALLSYNQSIEKAKMALDNGTATEADTKKKLLSAEEQLWTAYGKAYVIYSDPAYKTAQDESEKKIKELGGEVVNAVEAQKKQEQATRELEAAQKKLADAQRELATARNSGKLGDIYSAEKKVATAQGEVTRLETIKLNVEKGDIELPDIPQEVTQTINTRVGEVITPDIPDEKTVTIKANTENITAQIAHLKEQMGNLEIGSIAFDKTQESLVDMNTLQSLINTQLKAGLKIDQTVTSDLMQQILGGQNIDDTTWQALIDEINQKLAELELPPIKLNFQTGDVAKDAKTAAKEWQAAGSAIQSVGSAMTQIEDPAAKVLGTVAQAIASVALAAAQAIGAEDTTASGWAWIGAAAAITGTMISTIAAIKSATAGAYAEGGIIPGNKYSGDQQLAWVNAGELILNRSQANNIANQLQGGTLGNLHLSATVSGEQIRLVLNNNGKRTGRGEYLTTRFS